MVLDALDLLASLVAFTTYIRLMSLPFVSVHKLVDAAESPGMSLTKDGAVVVILHQPNGVNSAQALQLVATHRQRWNHAEGAGNVVSSRPHRAEISAPVEYRRCPGIV